MSATEWYVWWVLDGAPCVLALLAGGAFIATLVTGVVKNPLMMLFMALAGIWVFSLLGVIIAWIVIGALSSMPTGGEEP